MRNISFFLLLVIIFLFSANNAVYSEVLTDNDEQLSENKEQIPANDEQFFVNQEIFEVNKNSEAVTGGKPKRYCLSIGPQFGFVNAQAVEIVYPTDTKGKYLSELLWNMKPLYYLGLQAEFGLFNIMSETGFFSVLSIKSGIPGDTGIHENRDWMSVENSNLTHYSKHTNRTNKFTMIDFKNGASIPLTYIYLKPFINFSWMNFSFSGIDGYGKYARGKKYDDNGSPVEDPSSYPVMFFPITDNPRKYTYHGEVITYEQNWFLLAPGFTLGTDILSPFSFDVSFQISPLTYCAAVDQHLTTKAIYYDYTGLGLFIESAGNVTFTWKFIELTYEFAYRYISDTKGETYQGRQSGDYIFLSPNKAGAGLSMTDMRFFVIFRL